MRDERKRKGSKELKKGCRGMGWDGMGERGNGGGVLTEHMYYKSQLNSTKRRP